jgi:hypothetical protein
MGNNKKGFRDGGILRFADTVTPEEITKSPNPKISNIFQPIN